LYYCYCDVTNSDNLPFSSEEVDWYERREYQVNNSDREHSEAKAKACHNYKNYECADVGESWGNIIEKKCIYFIDILGKSIHDSTTSNEIVKFSEWSSK